MFHLGFFLVGGIGLEKVVNSFGIDNFLSTGAANSGAIVSLYDQQIFKLVNVWRELGITERKLVLCVVDSFQ